MKKNCFTCEYYGRCSVNQKDCPDWSNKKSSKPVLDILNFNRNWQYINYVTFWKLLSNKIERESIHTWLLDMHNKSFKKWYNKDWHLILEDQLEINRKFLCGKSVDTFIDEASEIAHTNSIEQIK